MPVIKWWNCYDDSAMESFKSGCSQECYYNKKTGKKVPSKYLGTPESNVDVTPPKGWYIPKFSIEGYIENDLRANSAAYQRGDKVEYAKELRAARAVACKEFNEKHLKAFNMGIFFKGFWVSDFNVYNTPGSYKPRDYKDFYDINKFD